MEVRKDKRTVSEGLLHQRWIGGQERDLLGFTERNDYFESSCV